MKRGTALLLIVGALLAGSFLGSRFFAVPLRAFSVDSKGNQHCSGLRHGEHFEVFCLSTERPWKESAGRNIDRMAQEWAPGRRTVPSMEDHRAPWAQRR
jgi:hypothetical protein